MRTAFSGLSAETSGAKVGVWGKEDILRSLNTAQKMLPAVLVNLELYMSRPYPLPELHLVALPGYTDDKPIDAWGLQMFREPDLSKKVDNYWVAHILAKYAALQWTDHLTTPLFPTSLTLALSKFLADKVAWQVNARNCEHIPNGPGRNINTGVFSWRNRCSIRT